MAHYKGSYEAPRWANFKRYLIETCFYHDLELDKLDIDKGWIRESGIFKVSGSDKDILGFAKEFDQAIELYNQ